MRNYKAGEIVEALFPYEDRDESKMRPALVIKDEGAELLLLKITSKHKGRRWDMEIPKTETNGLSIDSVIQVDKLTRLKKTKLIDVIPRGTLNELQLGMVNERLKEYIRSSN